MVATLTRKDRLPRTAYPDAILFAEEQEGIWWLRGKDLARAKRILGFYCGEESVGFDGETAGYYIKALLEQGEQVGILRGNTVQPLVLRGSGDPGKVKSRTMGMAPELLFGLRELERLRRTLTRKHSPMRDLVERVRAEMTSGNIQAVTEMGTIYVYQVAQDMYEVEEELTTVPRAVLEALAVAAHLAGRMLKCQLVAPKPRRGRKGTAARAVFSVSEPVTYGQLRLGL